MIKRVMNHLSMIEAWHVFTAALVLIFIAAIASIASVCFGYAPHPVILWVGGIGVVTMFITGIIGDA